MELKQNDIQRFILELRQVSTYDFSQYSIKSFTRRIEKILNDYGISIDTLISKIKNDADFREQIVREITVNTTEIFRDPEMWINLAKIIKDKFADVKELRIWHAGVSAGQELYSMEILLHLLGFYNYLIFGTDLNAEILQIARQGEYPMNEVSEYLDNFNKALEPNFPGVKLEDFFEFNNRKRTLKVKDFLKIRPIFLKHDLVNEGNVFGTKFHIIMCRNVLIYFNQELQNKIFHLFLKNLYSNGVLVIGKHEAIIGELSYKLKRQGCIYTKKPVKKSDSIF